MTPHATRFISDRDWQLFYQIRDVIEQLPDLFTGRPYMKFPKRYIRLPRDLGTSEFIPNCHQITRALAKCFPVDVHDGHVHELRYGKEEKKHEHSWLTPHGGDGRVIIDPWPLGAAGTPMLVVQDYGLHYGPECSFLKYHQQWWFLCHTVVVKREIQKILERKSSVSLAA